MYVCMFGPDCTVTVISAKVTTSHSNPNVSHRVSDENQRGLGGAEYDLIGITPDTISESRRRNSDNECLVCILEVRYLVRFV